MQHYDAHAGAASCIDFHPSGEFIASTGEEEAVKVWDLREGRLLYKVYGHKLPPTTCAFAASGRTLLSGGCDNLVFIWDCAGGAEPIADAVNPPLVRRGMGQSL